MTPQSRTWAVALLFVAALLGLSAAFFWRHASSPVQLAAGTYLSPGRPLPDFSLIDQRGQPFGPRNFDGHWSLMFFGYTNCPDFCPTTLVTLAALEKNLRAAGTRTRPQVVFISVDAKRDTPQQLAKYVPYFDPEFIGATATDQPTIEALAHRLGVLVSLHAAPGGGYTVDHSAEIFVVDPAGKLTAVLSGPFTPAVLQADFDRIVAARG